MIVEILFIVFMVLWLASCFNAGLARYSGLLPWVCVALLAWMTHPIRVG